MCDVAVLTAASVVLAVGARSSRGDDVGAADGTTEREIARPFSEIALGAPVTPGLWVEACSGGRGEPVPGPPPYTAALDLRIEELHARARAIPPHASPALRLGLALLLDPDRAVPWLERAPDRVDRGFDHAAAAALDAGSRALARGWSEAALRWAQRAADLAPSDPAAPILVGRIAIDRGEEIEARRALERAAALEPDDLGVAWMLGTQLARTERLDEAVAALDRYLATARRDVARRSYRRMIAQQAAAAADAVRRERNGVVLLAPRELDADTAATVLAIVDRALTDAAEWTETERARELVVLVHDDEATRLLATCMPHWSGGSFSGIVHTDMTRMRSGWFDTMLRHEALHAQLELRRGARERLPAWLHEGAAQHFARDVFDLGRWRTLADERPWTPLTSLDHSFARLDSRAARLAYDQSFAIVHYLEEHRGRHAIAEAVATGDRVGAAALLPTLAPELDVDRLSREVDAMVATIEADVADILEARDARGPIAQADAP